MKRIFKRAVREEYRLAGAANPGPLTEEDILHIPEVVRNYIRITGFLNKPKVANFKAEFRGGIRFSPDEEFMPLKSVQYNFADRPSRLFYIVARKKGIPAIGLHLYRVTKATFNVKILGLYTVVDASGPKMDQAETVTILNDMCFIAPGMLSDPRIEWEELGPSKVKATFTNQHIRISAELVFNKAGELVNFISNDRFETNGKEYINYPWETPVSDYREIAGYRLPSKAKLIYKRPDGEFCYGEFEFMSVAINFRETY